VKVLVANLGSTSFKYRLFDMSDPAEPLLARGAIERIGSTSAKVVIKSARGDRELVCPIADHGEAVQLCLEQLTDPAIGVLSDPAEVAAIGFKAVHARNLTGVHFVDETVLAAMEAFADVAPAHNPPYTKAMRMLRERFPALPLVAAFETGFHRTIPEALQRYAIPDQWATEFGIRRWGFHGASHRYIATRMPELLGRSDIKVISCHLGGSSSLCAIRHGQSVASSLGMSPQTGLPHNNRVGDFDVFALPVILRETGKSLDEVLSILANKSGLEGLSGAGCDLRDIEEAANKGNARALLAIDVFVAAIRHFLGAYLLELNGADAIVFTGGIGENSVRIRTAVCRDLDWLGITLDPIQNQGGQVERVVSTPGSRVQVWTVPTNEEIVVARQAKQLLEQKPGR
jgi:acetate kinase